MPPLPKSQRTNLLHHAQVMLPYMLKATGILLWRATNRILSLLAKKMVGFLEIKGSLVGYQRALRVSFKPDGAASLTQCCEHGQLGVAHLAVLLFLLLRTSVTRHCHFLRYSTENRWQEGFSLLLFRGGVFFIAQWKLDIRGNCNSKNHTD